MVRSPTVFGEISMRFFSKDERGKKCATEKREKKERKKERK
jgi:hypothetical protein